METYQRILRLMKTSLLKLLRNSGPYLIYFCTKKKLRLKSAASILFNYGNAGSENSRANTTESNVKILVHN